MTSAPVPAKEHPLGRSSKVAGTDTGSSTHRVSATPEPPTPSEAETVRWTSLVYHPLPPFGAPGLRMIVVAGGLLSGEGGVVKFRTDPYFFPKLFSAMAQK
jgi:hypothetical protein